MPDTQNNNLEALIQLMAKLRNPNSGCPWDLRQDFHTIAPYTIEEAYEVADAINRDDMEQLKDELGDLLFQVVFHARMAQELGYFCITDVIDTIVNKMVRRHPHVFADAHLEYPQALNDSWESIKAAERQAAGKSTSSLMDGVAAGLPGFLRALKLQKKAARGGFDWTSLEPVIAKLHEEIAELEQALGEDCENKKYEIFNELGDVLFSVVNVARHLQIDAEASLAAANSRFESRFRTMETLQGNNPEEFSSLSAAQLELLWEAAKAREAKIK